MTDIRTTQIGKDVLFTTTTDQATTQIGKEVVFSTTTDMRTTQIGKQVIWNSVPVPVVPPLVAPAAIPAREGAAYVDSFLEYDGRNAAATDGVAPGAFLTLSGGTTWAPGETLTLTANANAFANTDVGGVVYVLHEIDAQGLDTGTIVRFTPTAFTSSTVVSGVTDIAVPTDMRTGLLLIWDRAVNAVAGLDHLDNSPVSILADDHIVASVYDVSLDPISVSNTGTVTLPSYYAHILVGLPYYADLETLDIDKPSGQPSKVAGQMVTRVGAMLTESRSFWVGTKPPDDDTQDPLQRLYKIIQPTDSDYETLTTGWKELNVNGGFDRKAHTFFRSVDPVPMGIGMITPEGFITPGGES